MRKSSVAKEESKKNTSVKKEETRKDELATSAVKIDFDGITDRVVKLPVSPSYYGNFYSDGNKVYYWGRGGTRVFDLKEHEGRRGGRWALLWVSNPVARSALLQK